MGKPVRPKRCNEPNCKPLLFLIDDPKIGSTYCYGIRTSDKIKGKSKSLKNAPCDTILNCILIGSHSEACGQHKFVMNMHDFELQLRHTFTTLHRLGILKEVCKRVKWSVGQTVGPMLERAFLDGPIIQVQPGTKFVNFFCSCGEEFLRVYTSESGGKWYRPTREDNIFMTVHKKLGHTIYSQKHRALKGLGRSNSKHYWRDYPRREFKWQV